MLAPLPALSTLPRADPLALDDGDVDLWFATDDSAASGPEALPPDERAAASRLLNPSRRRRFVAGRVLCRQALSRYAPIAPQEWRLDIGARGKPFVAAPTVAPPLWFNLSHAEGTTVCAITTTSPGFGVDIERVGGGPEALRIAEQFFSTPERAALCLLPAAERPQLAVRLWALKESYAKAANVGLDAVLGNIAFDLGMPEAITTSSQAPRAGAAEAWKFRLVQVDACRIVAVALRSQSDGDVTLRIGGPLVDE